MRIINIIEQSSGIITNVTSFGVFEEQLNEDVVEKAEIFFKEQLLKNVELDKEEEEQIIYDAIENRYYEEQNNNYYTINIIWSDI